MLLRILSACITMLLLLLGLHVESLTDVGSAMNCRGAIKSNNPVVAVTPYNLFTCYSRILTLALALALALCRATLVTLYH